MKIISNPIRFLLSTFFSIYVLNLFLYKFGDIGTIDYFIFFITFLVSGIFYFLDKLVTNNRKKGIYFFSILFYFVFMISYYIYALYHINISF